MDVLRVGDLKKLDTLTPMLSISKLYLLVDHHDLDIGSTPGLWRGSHGSCTLGVLVTGGLKDDFLWLQRRGICTKEKYKQNHSTSKPRLVVLVVLVLCRDEVETSCFRRFSYKIKILLSYSPK